MLSRALPSDEFDVHVGVLTRSGPLEEPLREAGIPVELIGKKWKLDPSAWMRTRKLIRRLKPDIVHTWIFAANCYGRHAAFCEKVPSVVAGERCVDPWKRSYELWIDRRLAKRTDRIATNSNGVVDFYAQHGIPRDKFTVIPNGIDPTCVDDGPSKAELIESLKLPKDSFLIGTVSRLWPQKRVKELIWSMELLRSGRDGDSHLLIVGDGPLRDRLGQFAGDSGLSPYVHFLGERRDAAKLMKAFDCFWLGSGYEGQSNAVMEAMCAGTPPIISDIPGNRDLVQHDRSGWLIPLTDTAGYARKAHIVFDEPERAKEIGEAARRRMLDEFTVERMIDGYRQLYQQLANNARG